MKQETKQEGNFDRPSLAGKPAASRPNQAQAATLSRKRPQLQNAIRLQREAEKQAAIDAKVVENAAKKTKVRK